MARRLVLVLLAGACLAGLAGCGSDSDPAPQATQKTTQLSDISNVLELRAAFNEDRGTPRLLILLSPT